MHPCFRTALPGLVVVALATLSAPAFSQGRITAPGSYAVQVGVVPAMLPPGSLPGDIPSLGPDLYEGTLDVSRNVDGSYDLRLRARRGDGALLQAVASFSADWAGFLLGSIPVGEVMAPNALIGIDVAHLLSARINGVGTVDGAKRHVFARIGGGGSVDDFRAVGFGPK